MQIQPFYHSHICIIVFVLSIMKNMWHTGQHLTYRNTFVVNEVTQVFSHLSQVEPIIKGVRDVHYANVLNSSSTPLRKEFRSEQHIWTISNRSTCYAIPTNPLFLHTWMPIDCYKKIESAIVICESKTKHNLTQNDLRESLVCERHFTLQSEVCIRLVFYNYSVTHTLHTTIWPYISAWTLQHQSREHINYNITVWLNTSDIHGDVYYQTKDIFYRRTKLFHLSFMKRTFSLVDRGGYRAPP